MKSKLVYWLTYAGMWFVALLPFRALYILSDGLCFLMRHVVHYRRKVVRRNLSNSFPEKSQDELRRIERKFYHYICDYMVEEVKMMRMSFEDLSRRMEYGNTEEYLAMIEKHGGIVILIPHYADFEWLTGMGAIMAPGDIPVQVYKPLRNKYLDEMFKLIRSRHGGYNVPKHSTAREVIRLRRDGKRVAIGLITDQSPNLSEAHYWTTFLNQDTVFMDGGERIAKMMDYPVFYCELEKKGRGYCKAYFDLLTENPKQTADGEITELFARRLEQTIRREPAYWFWSHKRWKLTRESVKRHG
ncbi:lysophospholipid acyltransferase family protein [uncultured Bacteroides sp.]|uniref:lysophospholipid acyltransferase family protein n=1 Tax=uncultured Bacteroides sp. TaxID=162156 RepID=UPI0023CFCE48|nr:lysophospholipid acyltransferase family protein [uncultured Bacteroides sp.]MDE6171500.1 lysophospholipid acyltransferase family protein [Bacteroides sp.]